jgi:anti-sigma regulatory factor (Ser/Thr protein kinase)
VREATIQLPPAPTSPAEARGFVVDSLEQWGAESLTDLARLLVSELVTNAVFHAHSPVEVRALMAEGRVRIEVRDLDPTPPAPRHAAPWDATGRGLLLVDELSERWGTDATPSEGKVIWFEL